MSTPNDVSPTQGITATSHQWIYEVAAIPANPSDEPVWLLVPDITALQPNSTPTTAEGGTYANKGQAVQDIVGESFNLSLNIKVVYDDATGDVIPGLQLLIAAANAMLDQNLAAERTILVRYYHYRIPSFAYQMTADVNWTRANTGNVDNEFLQITMNSKGDRKTIVNPALGAPVAPTVTGVTPPAAVEGAIVKIAGTGFKAGAIVTVDGDPAPGVVFVSPSVIYAQMPAGTAGTVPVIVKVGDLASASFDYERGA